MIIIYYLLAFAVAAILATSLSSSVYAADTQLIAISDVGCKSPSVDNLANIAGKKIPVLSAGDIRYKCDVDDIQPLWDNIGAAKHGVYGNHDVESSTSKNFVTSLFGLGPKGWFVWKEPEWNIGIIGINQYAKWDYQSEQYNYVKSKLDSYKSRSDIDWIVVVFHEPINTPTIDHGPNKPFRDVYGPLFGEVPNTFIIEAHNHATWFGKVDGINQAGCGSGGYGGDSVGSLNGFDYASASLGYCKFTFGHDNVTAQHIGTNNKVLANFQFTK